MAVTRGVKKEELNFIFKSLAERGKDGEIYSACSDFFRSQPSSTELKQLNEAVDDQVIFRPYGSEAENLKCYESHDFGDIDIMIFPYSDNLMIDEERLEYSPENPLHVRIRGSDHPALQSCLVENTEYVATSSLKSFHPAVFGPGMSLAIDFISFIFPKDEQEDVSLDFTADLKNNATSPAVTLSMSHFLGTISEQREMLKADIQNFPINEAAAEMEGIVHFLCVAKGIDYTREHAQLLNDSLLLAKDTSNMLNGLSIFAFASDIIDKFNKLDSRLQEVKSRSQDHALHNGDYQIITPEQNDEDGRRKSRSNCAEVASTSSHDIDVKATPQKFDVNRRSPEDLEPILRKKSTKMFHHLSEIQISNEVTEGDIVEGGSQEEKKREITTDNVKGEHSEDENETIEERKLKRRCSRWIESMVCPREDLFKRRFKDSERVKSGMDIIPAFKSRGWPKVAREWIKGERKWPTPEIVEKIIQEGFHLVAKPPQNNGNPDCDFRISFSHAEYLLSQEMNDIQRECYRCLKRYHRAYLSTQPKSLVSFHLKNIFLQTIEGTGVEMWTESNRTECMMKLLGNLLEALTKKDLRHFFVRSYNLFGEDYIENTELLQGLAAKVKQIMDDPMQFSIQLIQNQEETKQVKKEECVSKENFPRTHSTRTGKPAPSEEHLITEEVPFECINDTHYRNEKVTDPVLPTEATQESCQGASYRYHDLQDIYQEVTKQLVDMAFHDTDCTLRAMDPRGRSLVEDLRELVRNFKIPFGVFPRVFNVYWHKRAYYWIWLSAEPDIRHRVLVAIQALVELLKYHLKEDDLRSAENEKMLEALVDRILDPSVEHPIELSHIRPNGNYFIKFMQKVANMLDKQDQTQVDSKTSPVEKLKEMVSKHFDLSGDIRQVDSEGLPEDEILDFFSSFLSTTNWGRAQPNMASNVGNESCDMLVEFQGLLELIKQHELKGGDVRQGEGDEGTEDVPDGLLDLMDNLLNIILSTSAQSNSDDIPLD